MTHAKSELAKAVDRIMAEEMSGSAENAAWSFVDAIACVADATLAPNTGAASQILKAIKATVDSGDKTCLFNNPYFTLNGHGEDNPSLCTSKYFTHRALKTAGGAVLAIAGKVTTAPTLVPVDVAGIAMNGNSLLTTGAHISALANIAIKYKSSRTIAKWLDLVVELKMTKATVKEVGLIGATIPIPMVSIATGLYGAALAMGAKIGYHHACIATSLELHWRSFQEQFFGRADKFSTVNRGPAEKCGPASRICWELLTKRGATRIFGQYDVNAILSEPAGWKVINDKLMLI